MCQRPLAAAVVVAGSLVASAAASAGAAAAGVGPVGVRPAATFSSTIYSAATGTCVGIPGGTVNVNVNAVGSACSGGADQQFSFRPVTGQPTGTYNVVNAAGGLCLAQFRFGIRQYDCLNSSPESTQVMWTLLTVNATAHEYIFEPTNQVGDTTFRCMNAASAGAGTATLGLPYYTAGVAADVFTIAGLP